MLTLRKATAAPVSVSCAAQPVRCTAAGTEPAANAAATSPAILATTVNFAMADDAGTRRVSRQARPANTSAAAVDGKPGQPENPAAIPVRGP